MVEINHVPSFMTWMVALESEVAEIYIIFSFRQIDDTFYLTKQKSDGNQMVFHYAYKNKI
jgi:hypothetical protein